MVTARTDARRQGRPIGRPLSNVINTRKMTLTALPTELNSAENSVNTVGSIRNSN